jgi:hypothetical protein
MILNLLIAPFLDPKDGTVHVRLEIDYDGYAHRYRDLKEQTKAYQNQCLKEDAENSNWYDSLGIRSDIMACEQRQENDCRQDQKLQALLADNQERGDYVEAHAYRNRLDFHQMIRQDDMRKIEKLVSNQKGFASNVRHSFWSKARVEVQMP